MSTGPASTWAANTVVTLRNVWSGSVELGGHRPHRGRGHETAVGHDRAVPLLADVGAVRAGDLRRGARPRFPARISSRPCAHHCRRRSDRPGYSAARGIASAHEQRCNCSGARVLRRVRQGRGAERAGRVLHRRRRVPQHAGRSGGRSRGDPRPAQHVRDARGARRVPGAQHRRQRRHRAHRAGRRVPPPQRDDRAAGDGYVRGARTARSPPGATTSISTSTCRNCREQAAA